MRRVVIVVGVVILLAAVVALMISAPHKLPASELAAGYHPNLANGEAIFNAGNCAGCHQTPKQDNRAMLGGGVQLKSPFGTFVAPNISSDPQSGIGGWSEYDFVDAMKRGVAPKGQHLYPAFPYPSYSLLKTSDVRDLFAYLKTLPAVATPSEPHQLKFPFTIRRAVGFWKFLYFKPEEFAADPTKSALWNRGRYLAEGPAHCAECHTPRDQLGGPQLKDAYVGAPNLEAGGRFASNITPSKDGIGDWSEQDIADLLKSGMDKCFNEPEGMRGVIAGTSKLSDQDLLAIGTYIHALPAKPGNGKHKTC